MKNDKLIYSIGCIVVIGASLMKILHLPYANGILIFGFVGMSVYQSWHVTYLKKRIKELEDKVGI
ncbi:MAG: hypothetical protein KF763_20785 [Cyclobacteriaceae bacterium]|nr:hypothetical protein [Cyclobacteriaceae bacterium]